MYSLYSLYTRSWQLAAVANAAISRRIYFQVISSISHTATHDDFIAIIVVGENELI
jgi:hypothetical protein